MFHHIVLMRFHADSTPDQHRAIADALRGLPAVIPEIGSYDVRLDTRLADQNAHLSVAATFSSEADWRTYSAHPTHQAIIAEQIAPILESILRTQFED